MGEHRDKMARTSFSPTLDVPKPQAATMVVAASDSLNPERADYVCDGVADEVEINAAHAALPVDGGRIVLLEGTYTLAAPIVITKDVTLEGQTTPYYTPVGRGTSIVNGGIGTDAIQLTGDHDFTPAVKNMMISGSGATGNGITITKAGNFILDNLIIDDVGAKGVEVLGCWVGKITNCEIRHNGDHGISLDFSGADRCTAIEISSCHFGANTTYDVYMLGALNVTVKDNYFEHYTTTETFIYTQDSSPDIVNNYFSADNAGTDLVRIVGGGVLIDGNNFGGAHASGVYVTYAAVRIVNNTFNSGSTTEEIYLGDTTVRAIISNNIILTEDAFGIDSNFNGPLEIRGNQIICSGTGFADDAIRVLLAVGAIVADNYITGARQYGIRTFGSSTLIANNTVIGSQRAQVYVAADNCRVLGNLIKDGAIEGILTTAAAISGIISGNHLDGNGVLGLSLDAASVGIVAYDKYVDSFVDVLAASANYIVNAQNLVNGAVTLTGSQPKYPRGLVFDITEGTPGDVSDYTMTVVGINGKGQTITEVFTFADDGLTFSSDNAFDHVTSITLADVVDAGGAATLDVGIDERLGLMNRIYEALDIWKITKNGAKQVVAQAQVDTDFDLYDMSVIGLVLNDDFEIWYKSSLNLINA